MDAFSASTPAPPPLMFFGTSSAATLLPPQAPRTPPLVYSGSSDGRDGVGVGADDDDGDDDDMMQRQQRQLRRERREPGGLVDSPSDDESDSNRNNTTNSSSSSSDDEWGTVRGDTRLELIDLARSLRAERGEGAALIDDMEGEETMFIPEPVIQICATGNKPDMPYHTKDQLPVGSRVWVVDEEDVALLMNAHWSTPYLRVCNGKLCGSVVRHSGEMTMVLFHDEGADLDFSLTLPRACLSLAPIEPYESNPCMKRQLIGSYYSNLGPRAGAGRPACMKGGRSSEEAEEVPSFEVYQQYYELVPALRLQVGSAEELFEAEKCFRFEKYNEAISLINSVLERTELAHPHWLDAMLLRSRVYVFQERHEEALADAKACMEVEPRWIRGYLSAARAHSGLGQFAEAGQLLRRAGELLSHSSEIERLKALNRYLDKLQQQLIKTGRPLRLMLDHLYRKLLLLQSDVDAGAVIVAEDTPVLATHSIFGTRIMGRCCVCFRPGAMETDTRDISPVPQPPTVPPLVGSEDPATGPTAPDDASSVPLHATFCGHYCRQRSSLFYGMETKYHDGVDKARELMLARGAFSPDPYPLEMTNMTVRLFFMVITTHRRLTAQRRTMHLRPDSSRMSSAHTDEGVAPASTHITPTEESGPIRFPTGSPPSVPLDSALQHLGIYPLVSDHVSAHVRNQVRSVYDALTSQLKDEERAMYSYELFGGLFNYVKAYIVPVELQEYAPGRDEDSAPTIRTRSVFFLPRKAGYVQRSSPPSEAAFGDAQNDTSEVTGSGLSISGRLNRAASESEVAQLKPNCMVRFLGDADTFSAGDSTGGSWCSGPGGGVTVSRETDSSGATIATVTTPDTALPTLLELVATVNLSWQDKLCLPSLDAGVGTMK